MTAILCKAQVDALHFFIYSCLPGLRPVMENPIFKIAPQEEIRAGEIGQTWCSQTSRNDLVTKITGYCVLIDSLDL